MVGLDVDPSALLSNEGFKKEFLQLINFQLEKLLSLCLSKRGKWHKVLQVQFYKTAFMILLFYHHSFSWVREGNPIGLSGEMIDIEGEMIQY